MHSLWMVDYKFENQTWLFIYIHKTGLYLLNTDLVAYWHEDFEVFS
jgi:hypothetical protein